MKLKECQNTLVGDWEIISILVHQNILTSLTRPIPQTFLTVPLQTYPTHPHPYIFSWVCCQKDLLSDCWSYFMLFLTTDVHKSSSTDMGIARRTRGRICSKEKMEIEILARPLLSGLGSKYREFILMTPYFSIAG